MAIDGAVTLAERYQIVGIKLTGPVKMERQDMMDIEPALAAADGTYWMPR